MLTGRSESKGGLRRPGLDLHPKTGLHGRVSPRTTNYETDSLLPQSWDFPSTLGSCRKGPPLYFTGEVTRVCPEDIFLFTRGTRDIFLFTRRAGRKSRKETESLPLRDWTGLWITTNNLMRFYEYQLPFVGKYWCLVQSTSPGRVS